MSRPGDTPTDEQAHIADVRRIVASAPAFKCGCEWPTRGHEDGCTLGVPPNRGTHAPSHAMDRCQWRCFHKVYDPVAEPPPWVCPCTPNPNDVEIP